LLTAADQLLNGGNGRAAAFYQKPLSANPAAQTLPDIGQQCACYPPLIRHIPNGSQ